MSQNRYSKNFTKDQLRQHKQLGNQLQRANAAAAQALLTLRRFRPGEKRSEHVYTQLANVVLRMNVLIACCEQIATCGFEKKLSRINVILGTTCRHCEESGRSARRSSGQGYAGSLEADPAWGVLVGNLLVLATSAIQRAVGSESCSLSNFEEPRCLQNLIKVLLREQRHLARMGGARAPEIVVIYDDAEFCSECGNPYTGGPLDEH